MATTARIVIIADFHGRVLAAELPVGAEHAATEEEPTGRLVPIDGQRAIGVDVPSEILQLSGPDLQRYFSDVQISFAGEVELPKTKVEQLR